MMDDTIVQLHWILLKVTFSKLVMSGESLPKVSGLAAHKQVVVFQDLITW